MMKLYRWNCIDDSNYHDNESDKVGGNNDQIDESNDDTKTKYTVHTESSYVLT